MTLARGRLVRAADVGTVRPVRGDVDRIAELLAVSMENGRANADQDDRSLDRVVELSRLLAERLLRKSLELDPATMAALARGVLLEAQSARRVRVFVNPNAVEVLRGAVHAFDPDGRVQEITADAALGPLDLRLETELGNVDATLETGLDLLAQRLRDALRS